MEEKIKNIEYEECYSPESIVNIYNNVLNISEERKQINIEGVYKKCNSKLYNKYYYDKLLDINTKFEVTLMVSKFIRERLDDGCIYKFKGYLNRKVTSEGSIQINYYIMKILSEKKEIIPDNQYKTLNVQKERYNIGYKDIDQYIKDKLYNKESIKIALVIGNNGIIQNDIFEAMKESKDIYDISLHKINLASIDEIMNKLLELDDKTYDIIALSRGGGRGIEVFDDPDIAEVIVKMKTRTISAIGHADDKPLFQKIVDKKFDTPSNFGVYLKKIYIEVLEQEKKDEVKKIEKERQDKDEELKKDIVKREIKAMYEAEINKLNSMNSKLENKIYNLQMEHHKGNNNIEKENKVETKKYICIAIIVGIIIGILLSKIIK